MVWWGYSGIMMMMLRDGRSEMCHWWWSLYTETTTKPSSHTHTHVTCVHVCCRLPHVCIVWILREIFCYIIWGKKQCSKKMSRIYTCFYVYILYIVHVCMFYKISLTICQFFIVAYNLMFRCVCSQLRAAMEEGLVNQKTALQFMGERFRVKAEIPDWVPDEIVTKQLLKYVHV